MHFKYGKVSGMGCLKQGTLGWDGVARGNGTARWNGHSTRMGYPGIWGSKVGLSTQEVWDCPEEIGCPFSILLQPGRGRQSCRHHLCLHGKEGVNWIRIPPSLLNSLIHFLCSYFFLSLSSSLSCRLIKNSLSLKVFVSKQLRCQLGAKQ